MDLKLKTQGRKILTTFEMTKSRIIGIERIVVYRVSFFQDGSDPKYRHLNKREILKPVCSEVTKQ